jgi:hypothetical protein
MVAVAVCVVVLLSSLPTDLPNDIWAPSAPVLPFMLLVAVCWSIACGDAFLLPLAAFLTSFVSQAHLAYLLPSVLILGIACAGLVVAVRHDRQGVGGRSGHPVRRWVLLGACVMVVCWSLPGLDQALGWAGRDGHGNLGHIVDAAGVRGKTAGLDAGVHALVSAVGVPPWWLRTLPPPQMKTFEIFGASSAVARITALGWLLALAAALIAGWRRGRQDVVTACAIAGSLCLAIVAFTASFPNRGGLILSYSYSSWWEVPAGMWVWVLVTWSVVSLLPLRRPAQLTTRAAYALGMVGAALLLGLLGFRTRDHAVNPNEYRPSGSLIAQIREHAPRDEPVQVVGHTFGFDSSAVYALRLEGLDVGSSDARELGRPYATEGRRFAQIVEITEGDRPPSPKARVIARVPLQGTPPRTITALLRPGD